MTDENPVTDTGVPKSQEDMSLSELAQAVLSREIRPRVGSIRRLAEAVLETQKPKKKKKKKDAKKGKRRVAKIAKAKKPA